MRRPPSLRNNNGAVQVRVRLDGRDHFINRLGRWDDPVAVARAQALSARIWSDATAGSLDQSLKSYRVSVLRAAEEEMPAEIPLEEVLRVKAERTRQAVVIHAHRTLLRFGAPLRTAAEVQGFADWMRDEGLSDRTIAGVLGHCRSCSGSQRHLFEAVLKKRVPRRSVHSDVLSKEQIQAVLMDLESKERWFYQLFLLWLSTGLRNGEIRGLTWDCVRWGEGGAAACAGAGDVEEAPDRDEGVGSCSPQGFGVCDTESSWRCLRPTAGEGVEAQPEAMWIAAQASLQPAA